MEMPCIIRVCMPVFSASMRSVTWVVAMKGSPGTKSTVFPVSVALSICFPFSSSSVCRVIWCIFLLQSSSRWCMLKLGMRLVYVSINMVLAVLSSSKPFRVMPYSSFKPSPTKTSSFIPVSRDILGLKIKRFVSFWFFV